MEPTSILAEAVLEASQEAAKKSIEGALASLAQRAGSISKSVTDRMIVGLGIGFQNFLQTTHQKCSQFKTILNTNKPIDLISNYVSINLRCGNESISDHDLIESLDEKKLMVITGLAGSGKSMFMKYLTLCRFQSRTGAMPLFVELRHLNKLSARHILPFIRSSCTTKNSNITDDQFKVALKSGLFTLILDGFDEINFEIREEIESQILDISKNYPETTIIISSRPDERFGAWGAFFVYKVEPLRLEQTIRLIQSFDYDSDVKKRFLAKVKNSLYETHTSFLSSPLLTTIMLLTYEEFAEIPEKMHIFYSQAFDTLFQRHDAQKEQYQRQTRTRLSRLDFKLCFSAFCFFTYYESLHSFDERNLLSLSNRAIDYVKKTNQEVYSSVTPGAFISDLIESVCMLQPDGILTSFVHRSFQEYFCAEFIASLPGENIKAILDRLSVRFADNVIPMAYDINRSAIEQHWVLPTIRELTGIFVLNEPNALSCAERLSHAISRVRVYQFPDESIEVSASFSPNQQSVMYNMFNLRSLYKEYHRDLMPWIIIKKDAILARSVEILHDKNRKKKNYSVLEKLIQKINSKSGFTSQPAFTIDGRDQWWIGLLDTENVFEKMRRRLQFIQSDIENRADGRQKILDLLLEPPRQKNA